MPVGGKQIPTDWGSAGDVLMFEEAGDLWLLRQEAGAHPERVVQGPADESDGRLSPDGDLFAFSSDASGRREVYIGSLSRLERRWQVSPLGGHSPVWRRDGRELFYIAGDLMLNAVRVEHHGNDLRIAEPVPLFKLEVDPFDSRGFVAVGKGDRFLVNHVTRQRETLMTLVLDWAGR
jgi:dipeptidyl aminopeptidase/acylaminoacyl peptidase